MEISLLDIITDFNLKSGDYLGAQNILISSVAPFDSASMSNLTFCNRKGDAGVDLIKKSKASIIICHKEHCKTVSTESDKRGIIFVDNPRLFFIKILSKFFTYPILMEIDPSAQIGENCRIAKDVFIGKNVVIGNNTNIGKKTIIHSGVQIYDNITIGKNVTINSGTVIGADGFSYERELDGKLIKFLHIGGVKINDDVEIGANTCIDRGTMSDTIIGKGTKIDNLVHIAHNVEIGENCMIIALSMIGGSTKIGKNTWVSPCSCIRDQLSISENVFIGMGSVVLKNVEKNALIYGVPAKKRD